MYMAENQNIFVPCKLNRMTKLIPISIEGERWVQLSQLSKEHAMKLKTWLPVSCFKSIFLHGMELRECISFEIYEYWFCTSQLSDQKSAVFEF